MMSAFAGYLLQNSLGETIDEYIEFDSCIDEISPEIITDFLKSMGHTFENSKI